MTGADLAASLIGRFVAGDRRAFDDLMRAEEDRVFAVCMRIMGSRADALDATQDTFVTVFRKAHQYDGRAAVSTWLYRIAVNTCYDLLRKQKRRPAEAYPEGFDPADTAAIDEMGAVELRPELEDALARLPQEYRTAVILSDLHGLALPDVAEVLGVPVGTVKSRVFRGRRQLASIIGNRPGSPNHPNNDA